MFQHHWACLCVDPNHLASCGDALDLTLPAGSGRCQESLLVILGHEPGDAIDGQADKVRPVAHLPRFLHIAGSGGTLNLYGKLTHTPYPHLSTAFLSISPA